jgi:hypothetical protein
LHYNGSTWSRVALKPKLGGPVSIIPDGHGGLWIPDSFASPTESGMEHYSHGVLSKAALPYPSTLLALAGAANARGGSGAIAFGFIRNSADSKGTAVVFRYES